MNAYYQKFNFLLFGFLLFPEFVNLLMRNEAIVVGRNFTFQCDFPLFDLPKIPEKCVTWIRYKYSYSYENPCFKSLILIRNNMPNLIYSYTHESTYTLLYISTNDTINANTYFCIDRCGTSSVEGSILGSADLVMMALEPKCKFKNEKSMENSTLIIICSVNVSGSWIPQIRWISWNGIAYYPELLIITQTIPTGDCRNTTRLYSITSELILPADYTLHEKTFFCSLFSWKYVGNFDANGLLPNIVNATNVPSYTFNWTSDPANILFAPKFVNIKEHIDSLECSSIGNPMPIYSWNISNIIGNIFHKSNFKEIGNYTITCYAVNKIENALYSNEIQFFVVINKLILQSDTEEVADAFTVGGLVGSLCTILTIDLIALIIFIVFKIKK